MKKSSIAGLIGLSFTIPAISAEQINLDDVVVTANRFSQSRDSVLGDVSVIGQAEIERAGAGSITDLLKLQPGVQINTNGGAGTASNVFLRGTNSDHLVVLIDGLRINSATSGTTAFENIPLSQIEKIEILRGPATSLYGADAIGGVIQIFTKKGKSGKPLVTAAIGAGSFNTKKLEAGVSGGLNDTRYGINVNSFETQGFSAQRITARNAPIDQDNDGYRNLGLSAYLNHTFSPGHSAAAQYFASKGRSSFDGNNFDNFGNQTLQSFSLASNNQLSDFWHSTLKLGKGIDDSDSHSRTGVSLFKTEQNQLTWQHDLSLPLGKLTLAYDRLEQRVSGSTNYTVNSRDNNGYLASYLLDIGKHAMQASLRNDSNSQYGRYTTGGIGYGYRISPEWRLAANAGSAFKAPTFNQLYFPGFGNPLIQPEESKNIEASAIYTSNKLRAGITVFDNKITNLIAFSSPVSASCARGSCPVNVGLAEILGATFDGSLQLSDDLKLSANFTVQSPQDSDTEKLLIRRSNRYGALSLLHNIGDFQWGSELTGASDRYNNPTNTKKMAGYVLLNLTSSYRINPEWKLEARANNILDKDYILSYTGNLASSVAYNTAGTNLFVGLRYSMNP
jgi:vitamin B12 transporter